MPPPVVKQHRRPREQLKPAPPPPKVTQGCPPSSLVPNTPVGTPKESVRIQSNSQPVNAQAPVLASSAPRAPEPQANSGSSSPWPPAHTPAQDPQTRTETPAVKAEVHVVASVTPPWRDHPGPTHPPPLISNSRPPKQARHSEPPSKATTEAGQAMAAILEAAATRVVTPKGPAPGPAAPPITPPDAVATELPMYVEVDDADLLLAPTETHDSSDTLASANH